MIKSLWIKFLILLVFVSVVSLSSALVFRQMILKDFNEYLEGEREDRVYRIMASMEGSYEGRSGWHEGALRQHATWALLLGYEIRVIDGNGTVQMDTERAMKTVSPYMKRRIEALSGLAGQRGEERPFMEYPLFLAGKDIGHLQIRPVLETESPGKEKLFMMRSNRFLLLSLLIVGGLSVAVSLVFSKRLTEPIKRMTAAARDISEGNTLSRVPVSGSDELGNLARTFNAMAASLEVHESLRRRVTSNIAHELRTPLTVMRGELEGMIDGLIPVDRERLLSLQEETARFRKIIEGMEELSRAEASALELKKSTFSLTPFLQNIKERYENLFKEKGVSLGLRTAGEPTLYGDPDRISQIVINLLINALNATEKGGKVLIRAEDSMIEIDDTGSGIRKEDVPFIFERFYKSEQGGLGLGLAIAKELAEAHGGSISVRSEPGKGSAFTLRVPNFTTFS
jgi:two-component system, OmpR family, sensor histidine kinase BaeS